MITSEIFAEAKRLWDYHHLNQIPVASDCILVLGSHDLRVAERGAELYLQELAPILIYQEGWGMSPRVSGRYRRRISSRV
jgi:hypothetical protein